MLIENRRLRFVFITPCVGESFFGPVKRGMHDAAEDLAVDCAFLGTEDVDLREQIDLMKQAMAEGCDGIALSVIHPTAFDDVVHEAIQQDIPVVGFNVEASSRACGCLSAVCQDFDRAGRMLGEKVSPSIGDGASILMTVHSTGISALEDRLRGMQEVVARHGASWQMMTTGTEPLQAAELIGARLAENRSIQAVLCTGQADTEGAGLAVERSASARSVLVAGFDLSPEILRLIRKGHIAFTIDQQPYVQGYYPVVQLTHYCRYGISPSDIDAGAAVIGRKNVAAVAELCKLGYR